MVEAEMEEVERMWVIHSERSSLEAACMRYMRLRKRLPSEKLCPTSMEKRKGLPLTPSTALSVVRLSESRISTPLGTVSLGADR